MDLSLSFRSLHIALDRAHIKLIAFREQERERESERFLASVRPPLQASNTIRLMSTLIKRLTFVLIHNEH